jgi:DNA damage-inducible protein 1
MQSDPYRLSGLQQDWPTLAEAIRANDVPKVQELLTESAKRRAEAETRRRRLLANPDDPETQRMIEEEIQLQNVEALRQNAMEHMPESFGSVVMLYVNVRVNGHDLKAFVDSGAQMTIMSQGCAERCGMMRFVDRRFQGMAVGVGSQKIVGRVHMYALEIAGDHLPTSFSILEQQPMDMLLGLDMLRRHQCVIDLRENRLIIGTTGSTTPFLSEADIPKSERLTGAEGGPEAGGAAIASADAGTDEAKESAVQALLSLGNFTRDQALEALVVCDGDQERAASYLLSPRE